MFQPFQSGLHSSHITHVHDPHFQLFTGALPKLNQRQKRSNTSKQLTSITSQPNSTHHNGSSGDNNYVMYIVTAKGIPFHSIVKISHNTNPNPNPAIPRNTAIFEYFSTQDE
jgi:hypothetical protein